ncbi:(2Fe-2S)-binding protein [Thalassobius sp. Cn5-15]|nr:(2Fe-2S)-binding protein [Thalassobius sp. Cn5-15]MCG7492645.1 (2Fe-2S)-binding protein [Thalassobius sp. Cn5-15]
MIICSCQVISDTDVHNAIDWMRASDASTIITPGKIYHALGKSPDCGGCMKLFIASMRTNPNLEVPAELRSLRNQQDRRSMGNERRQEGY